MACEGRKADGDLLPILMVVNYDAPPRDFISSIRALPLDSGHFIATLIIDVS